ncbi:MAG: hypothetical protein Q8Q39_04325 [bacterium]|nr:hypothetical protein [bacterium]
MKSTLIIVVTIIIIILGVIVGATLLLGGREGGDGGSSTVRIGRSGGDQGVLISDDAGETWVPRARLSEKSGIGGIGIYDMVFVPQTDGEQSTSQMLMGSAGNGLFVSTTGTATATADWIRVVDPEGILAANATIYEIAIDPHDPRSVYLAVTQQNFGMVLRTHDGGETFSEIYRSPKAQSGVYTVAVDYDFPHMVYIGTSDGGFLTSNNRGESWSVRNWFASPIRRLYIHPQDGNFMYLLFLGRDSARIERSYDRGVIWQELKVTPPKGKNITGIFDLAFHPTDPNVLFLGTSAGVFKTADAGATWEEFPLIIPPNLLPITAIAVDPADTLKIYVAAATQLYKSIDGGATWQVHVIPTPNPVRMLKFGTLSSDMLWAGVRK